MSKKILVNIRNTMSDRAATETKFNRILEEYRTKILPDVIEGYEAMTESDQVSRQWAADLVSIYLSPSPQEPPVMSWASYPIYLAPYLLASSL